MATAILVEERRLKLHLLHSLTVRLAGIFAVTGVVCLCENTRVCDTSFESTLPSVRHGGTTDISVHDLTNAFLTLKDIVCLGQFLVYPFHVNAVDSRCSPAGAAKLHLTATTETGFFTSRISIHLSVLDCPKYKGSLITLLGAITLPGRTLGRHLSDLTLYGIIP